MSNQRVPLIHDIQNEDFNDDSRDDASDAVSGEGDAVKNPQDHHTAVVFKLSDERLKQKKQASKSRRDFIRDRLRDSKLAR